MDKEIKCCSVCGVDGNTKHINYYKKYGMFVCDKHYMQLRNHGKTLDTNPRGIFDPNEVRVYSDHAEVDCYDSYGNVVNTYIVDVEDVDFVKTRKWRTTIKNGKPYMITGNKINFPITYYARAIMNAPSDIEVDHIDGNTLNNHKNNLRFADRMIQTCNLAPKCTNKIGVRGVSYSSRDNIYKVDFYYNKIRYYLKPFNTAEEAVYARYLLEIKINPYRYTSNDDYIMTFIERLSDEQKIDIEAYIDDLIRRKSAS